MTDLSKFIKKLLMHIGDNELNDYDESVLKTVKKCLYK